MTGPKKPSASMAFIEKHRALLVCIGVLPASTILKVLERFHRWITSPRSDGHEARVQRVCEAVRQWRSLPESERRPMCTDRNSVSSHSVRLADKTQWHRIQMGDLRAILHVDSNDSDSVTVTVEPGVTVREVTRFLLARGLQLECTLEMEDATIGGLAAATGMTTHSHICGLIHDTIISWEIVTADGEVVIATADNEHSALFHALPFSHGSLGLIVALTLRCVRARPFVRLTYTPFTNLAAFIEKYTRTTALGASVADGGAPFYAEAIIFSPDSAVLMEGVLTDSPSDDAPLNEIGAHWQPWFYTHVRDVLTGGAGRPVSETVRMYDYLMRHDRSM